LKLKKINLVSICSKKNLRDCLNFESLAPLKLQRPIKCLKILKGKKRKEKRGEGDINSLWNKAKNKGSLALWCKSLGKNIQALDKPNI
jgi:hypothetical protein